MIAHACFYQAGIYVILDASWVRDSKAKVKFAAEARAVLHLAPEVFAVEMCMQVEKLTA